MIAPTPTPDALIMQRKAAGLTQETAATLLGVSRRSIAGWETGERDMPRPLWTLFLMLTAERQPSVEHCPVCDAANPADYERCMGCSARA